MSRSAPSGSPRARRWRSSARCRRSSGPTTTSPRTAPTALFGRSRRARSARPAGGGAGQDLHQRLALHPVRHRQPVLHDRRPAGVDYTNVLGPIREDYPRVAGLPGPGFAAGPCLFKDTMQLAAFTRDHFPLGQAAMQVNEGLPAYIVVGAQAPLRRAPGQDGRHPRHGLQGRVRRHPGVARATSSASSCRGPARGPLHRSVHPGRPARAARMRARRERRPGPRRPAQGVPRTSRSAARTSSTSGARWARGIQL